MWYTYGRVYGAKMFILNKYKLFTGFSVTKLYFLINMLNNKIVPCLNQCRISDYLREKKINLRPHRLRLRPNYMRFQSIVSRISRLIVITPSETISFGKANKSKKVRWHVQSLRTERPTRSELNQHKPLKGTSTSPLSIGFLTITGRS